MYHIYSDEFITLKELNIYHVQCQSLRHTTFTFTKQSFQAQQSNRECYELFCGGARSSPLNLHILRSGEVLSLERQFLLLILYDAFISEGCFKKSRGKGKYQVWIT
jgi:hypothetical protein